MKKQTLKQNAIKKSVIIPLLITVALIIVAIFTIPNFIDWLPTNTDKQEGNSVYNEKDYYLVDYKNFDNLRLNNFAGWLSSDDVALGCAVTYDSEFEDTDAASLLKSSTEPWNDGCPIIVGANKDVEFRNMHKAKLGDRVTVAYYGHDTYTYKITEITKINTAKEIEKYEKPNCMVMCLPFNDFTKLGSSYFYTVAVAELV